MRRKAGEASFQRESSRVKGSIKLPGLSGLRQSTPAFFVGWVNYSFTGVSDAGACNTWPTQSRKAGVEGASGRMFGTHAPFEAP